MIKTEFSKVKDLFLAYPYGFQDISQKVVDFYEKLIGIIPKEIQLFIIVNNESAGDRIKKLYSHKKIKVILVKDFHEIWLRDILGFNTGNNRIYRPIYAPDYYTHIYTSEYLDLVESQVQQIFKESTGAEVIELPLIIDGGNFVTNGQVAFLTDKVKKQNPHLVNYINKILSDYLGVESIIVESNKHDVLAHTDGYLNFLSKDEICVSKYPDLAFLKDDNRYVNELSHVVNQKGLKEVAFFDRPVAESVIHGLNQDEIRDLKLLGSARGIFINFLILNNTIILPEYTIPNYKCTMDYNAVNKQTLENKGYNVVTINCDELSKMGGSLHCISFTN